jgi:hypothetical protein
VRDVQCSSRHVQRALQECMVGDTNSSVVRAQQTQAWQVNGAHAMMMMMINGVHASTADF